MKAKRTWILIADGGHAKVLESDGPHADLVAVADMGFETELPAGRDLLSDRPGRGHESHGPARHAMEARSDPRRALKRDFARRVAERLAAKLAEKRFDRLVVVAPPQMLGDLREALPEAVRAKVAAELAHDLVNTPEAELGRHLADLLGHGTVR